MILEDTKNTNLHIDNIKCQGCGEEFCVTLRSDPDDEDTTLCGTCYGHVAGLDKFQEVIEAMDLMTQVLWQCPTKKLPKAVLERTNFVDKKRNVRS